ncbi:MAG: NAD-dependent deacylase [Salibacteraceae bacterium]|nr:NAD-dependent deacylase [Salibacteraceae bacterium]
MKRIIVFSGAGMSAESGLKTFRDSGGLWEEHKVEDVATPEAWKSNPELVLKFYNMRRNQVLNAQPNMAHLALKELENAYDVIVITQNIDDLHERAGSTNVIHLHGEILKARSERSPSIIQDLKDDLKIGDLAEDGHQLRPNIVWFGEEVPMFFNASSLMNTADILIIIGTSLNVYPAAGLIYQVKQGIPVYFIDPSDINNPGLPNLKILQENASLATPKLVNQLLQEAVYETKGN